jgi:tRNA G18 (ribose-2'-O)-methylase SpoU
MMAPVWQALVVQETRRAGFGTMARILMVGILYNIRSVYNTASIFRTADAAGFERLYLCGHTPPPVDALGHAREKFSKVALGAERSVPWEKTYRAADCIKRVRAAGYAVIALERAPEAEEYGAVIARMKKRGKIAVVVGNEVSGIPKPLRNRCDAVAAIPMRGVKESLNVAVAFGIAAFEMAKNGIG